jgi:hypothetical protein
MPTVLGKTFTRRELARRVGDFSQLFGVELLSHGDGRERALRMLRFRTGSGLSFDIMVDRAMDLGGMTFRGVPIGWHSPTGFRSPWLHEVDAEDGLGWLRSFSGMMNSCGLDHIMGGEYNENWAAVVDGSQVSGRTPPEIPEYVDAIMVALLSD